MLHALTLAEIEDCNHEKYENISAYNFEVSIIVPARSYKVTLCLHI